MTQPAFEDYWEEAIEADDTDSTGEARPSFYFRLPLIGLSAEQARKVRTQAEQVLGHYAGAQRAVVAQTFRSVVALTTIRLRPAAQRRRGNVFLVRVAADATDPIDQVRDDRGTVVACALKFSGDPDGAIGEVWHSVASGFDRLFFVRPER